MTLTRIVYLANQPPEADYLPFDRGIKDGLLVYLKRLLVFLFCVTSAFVLCGLAAIRFIPGGLGRMGFGPPTLVVSATSGRFQTIDGTQEYGVTIILSSPRGYDDPIRFCIEAPKDGQFVGEPRLRIPQVRTRDKITGRVKMVDKFDVSKPEREEANLDCYTVVGVRGGQEKLFIRYTIYSATPLPDSARLRVVPEGNVRVVEQKQR
jgi:hypothetical protein